MDIFISYRREGGEPWATLINDKLTERGIKAFFDRHTMHNGDFSEIIKENIDKAPNFLLILTPGVFEKKTSWVREEIKYAYEHEKNFIAITFDDFELDLDWEKEDDSIRRIRTHDCLKYVGENAQHQKACIDSIIERMIDNKGEQFSVKKKKVSNHWYSSHEMTSEDKKWILTDHEVCKKLDWDIIQKALSESVFCDKDTVNLFVYKAYDIDTYKKKYDLNPKKPKNKIIDQVYGVTYKKDLEHAGEVFGKDHFVSDEMKEEDYEQAIQSLLVEHNLPGFDIIDLTLVIKDTKNPELVVFNMVKYLNPDGGVIYIRELDDDYIDAYPDEKKLIAQMVKLLELDEGAGNRHLGKKIYTYLKKAGADKVYISDQIISTANHKSDYQQKMCDTYFSYLKPEMRELVKDHPENSDYKKAYEWLEENYDDVESLFRSTEFYFRSGYVTGYGVFKSDEDD